eukprot:2482389-Rhodomonas_salina.1
MEDSGTLMRKIRDLQMQVDSSEAERDEALRRVNELHRTQPLTTPSSTTPRNDLQKEVDLLKEKNAQLQKNLTDADEANLNLRKEISRLKKEKGDDGLTSRSFEGSFDGDTVPKPLLDEAK